jgi:hypothetical protein
VINLVEARAMLAALEDLVSEPAFQAASAAWQQKQQAAGCVPPPSSARPCVAHTPSPSPSVALVSLFPAQAALLRQLVGRSQVVAASKVPVEVATPDELHQRECLVAYLGLTRSHTHRAVPFCDAPESLLRALTRAAARLVIFGDVGTLARRSQWHGALYHLDAPAAAAEQALVGRLLAGLVEPEIGPGGGGPAAAEAWAATGGRSRESNGV